MTDAELPERVQPAEVVVVELLEGILVQVELPEEVGVDEIGGHLLQPVAGEVEVLEEGEAQQEIVREGGDAGVSQRQLDQAVEGVEGLGGGGVDLLEGVAVQDEDLKVGEMLEGCAFEAGDSGEKLIIHRIHRTIRESSILL